jgi:thioredoxin reductase (NADPH)
VSTDDNVEEVIICGSGPAGLTAAIYSARANMKPLVLEGMEPGGQLTTTTDVENYPGLLPVLDAGGTVQGVEGIQGPTMMEAFKAQAARFGTRFEMDEVERCDLKEWPYTVHTGNGETLRTKTLIIASGAAARYLGLENELRLRGYGVSACATCDGFFFRGMEVAVVGGGDSASEEATFLTRFASRVHLLIRKDHMRASKIMQQRALDNEKITIHWNTEVVDVLGEKEVEGVRIRNNQTGEESVLDTVQGLFLAIGHTPNVAPFRDWLESDDDGYLLTEPDSTVTKIPGVFACGDVKDRVYRQAITAAGSGCMAAIDAERWLEARGSGEG